MPTREEYLAEAYKRDILPPDVKAAYEEALNRGLVKGDKPGFISRTMSKVSNLITGEGRKDPNIGEYEVDLGDTPSFMGDLRTARGVIFSSEDEQIKDIIKDNIPGAEFKTDERGNNLVKIPGQDWEYINKPGLSKRDITNVLGQGAVYLKGGKTAAKMAHRSLPLRAAAVAGTEGALSTGMDLVAQQAGSEQGVDLPRAGATAVVLRRQLSAGSGFPPTGHRPHGGRA